MQLRLLMPSRHHAGLAALVLSSSLILASAANAVIDPDAGGGASPAITPVVAAPAEAAAAPAPVVPRPPQYTLHADIDLTSQQMTVTANGKVLHVYPISSGRTGHETPRGTFRPQWASKMHYSKKYDNAPMPHSVFFNGGIATHGTQSIGMLGRPASHGCIRLHPSAAANFYALVHKHGFAATRIVVRGTPRQRHEEVASRRQRDDGRRRVVQQRVAPGYGYAPAPVYGYGYSTYQPRPVYVAPRPAYNPNRPPVRYVVRNVRY